MVHHGGTKTIIAHTHKLTYSYCGAMMVQVQHNVSVNMESTQTFKLFIYQSKHTHYYNHICSVMHAHKMSPTISDFDTFPSLITINSTV